MKSTGIVRKIDELGRIVIPKEIRSVLNIKNNDSLAFSVENKTIILEKYSQMQSIKEQSNNIIANVSSLTDGLILITDKDRIITPGLMENKQLPNELISLIENRSNYNSKGKEIFNFSDQNLEGFFLCRPLLKESDPIGLIIIYKKETITSEDEIFINILKNIIENN